MSDKDSKKSFKPPQRHISLGIIPSNIAVGPLGFRAELAAAAKNKDTRALRIVSQENESEDQGFAVTDVSTPGHVVGGTEQGNDPTSKEDTGDTEEGGGEIAEASRDAKGDWVNTTLGVGRILFDVVQEAAEAFGPLKAALGTISAIYEKYEETVAVRKKIQDLCSRIAALEGIFRTPTNDAAEKGRRDGLLRKFKDIGGQLRSLSEKPRLQRFADHAQDDEEVSGLLEDLRETISDYQMVQQMAIYDQLINAAEAATLNNFRCAQAAEYRHDDRKGCLKGTRAAVLDEIELWTRDFGKPPVYWLNGLAGTGKSTIAQTIAERVFAAGQLGASFFCSRDYSDRSNLHFIFPTLAVQLARKYTEFRSTFIPLVRSDPGIAHESLHSQMKKLIVEPLEKSAISTVIVVDALDECKDEEPASAILSVLGQFVSQIPKVKFFLTGRPERRIQKGFCLPLLAEATDMFVLHNVEMNLVNNDIRLFFKKSFLETAKHWNGLDGWPTKEQLDCLCERAAGLFVYAVATVKFVHRENGNPKKQLDRLLQSPDSSREGKTRFKADTTLDSLYTSILQEAFDGNDPEDDHVARSVLGAVILATNPLSPSAIATLLDFDIEDVLPLLSSIGSLLLQENISSPVRPFHKSFPDFITNSTRCINERFHVYPPSHHLEILVGCLELMNRTLEKNICKLPDAVMNSEVDDLDERIERYLDPALRYACKSWHKHLVDENAARTHAFTSALHRFLEKKFLFWLEVLSVLGAAREAVDALEVAARWLEASQTLDLVNDCSRFVTGFFEVISTSSPHIFHSALPLSPRKSLVRGLYESHAHPLTRIVHGLPTSWDPSTAAARFPSSVDAAAWSPCSRSIAISWGVCPPTVEILDAATLVRLTILEFPVGDLGSTTRLIFSPDGRLLTWSGSSEMGSERRKYISWDLQTGVAVSAVSAEETFSYGPITYSACGTMFGVLSYIHGDLVISTYNVLSGTHICSHPIYGGSVSNEIWTQGECLRFTTISLRCITTWETRFSSTYVPTEVETLSIPDNCHNPDSFLDHPTLPRLALVHKGRIRIWDTRDSRFLLDSSHAAWVPRSHMSFSPDGRFFAYSYMTPERGSISIYLWKESHTGYVLHQKLTSDFMGITPLISPNGGAVIVFDGLSGVVQLWRTIDSTTSLSAVSAQTSLSNGRYFVLQFSPDEALAAVARRMGNMITVLDLKSGIPRLIIDTDMEVHQLGVTGSSIVAVGDEKTVTWNLPAGDRIPNLRVGVIDSVRTATLDNDGHGIDQSTFATLVSPDLRYFAVTGTHGSDCTPMYSCLCLYDVPTGNHLGTVTQDHPFDLTPWFTPDGCEIWCWGIPGQVERWEIVEDGESGVTELEYLGSISLTRRPSRKYRVTDSGWILGPRRKRLFWLPPQWRAHRLQMRWGGRFLALLHKELPEVVVLEFSE